MLKSAFIEDIFIQFVGLCSSNLLTIQRQDLSAALSFYNILTAQGQLTKNQASYIIKILQKYKIFAKMAGLEYDEEIKNPQWKRDFRVLDLSKRVYIEKDEDNEVWICLRFPFALKDVFEKEFSSKDRNQNASIWDYENRVRKVKLYSVNIIDIFDFVQRHEFEIDDSFMLAMGEVEEIWQNSEEIEPLSMIVDQSVILVNANDETVNYYNEHKTGNLSRDLMLAKSMGYFYAGTPKNVVEKVAQSSDTNFWFKGLDDFFNFYREVDGTVAVILNNSNELEQWVKNFVTVAEKNQVKNEEIRICFRKDKKEDRGFNQWVKDSGYGGPVEGGKILLFQNKPPKWLFTKNVDVTIILTNSLFPIPNTISQAWMENHPCVCFVGDVKAAYTRNKKIVEL